MRAYFFPGLGADESLSRYHRIDEWDITWVKWPKQIIPKWDIFKRDLLLENEIKEGSLFVGISFGGLVASQIASQIKPAGLVLLGSLTTPSSAAVELRMMRWGLPFLPSPLLNLAFAPKWLISFYFGIKDAGHLTHFFEMAKRYSPKETKSLALLALSTPKPEDFDFPVFAVHGEKDRILPASRRTPGLLLKSAGHLLSMTHSEDTNRAILEWTKGLGLARTRE